MKTQLLLLLLLAVPMSSSAFEQIQDRPGVRLIPASQALNEGLYSWSIVTDEGKEIEMVSLVVKDQMKAPVMGYETLLPRPVLLNVTGETPVALTRAGDTFIFAQKKAEKTYNMAPNESGEWTLEVFDHLAKGASMRKILGNSGKPEFRAIKDLSDEEKKCASTGCMEQLKEKYFKADLSLSQEAGPVGPQGSE